MGAPPLAIELDRPTLDSVASKPLPFGTTRQYRSPMYSAP